MTMSDQPELTPVREVHRLDEEGLATYLTEESGIDFSAMTVLQFEGGQSNPTFQVSANGRKYVLRKKPPGKLLKSAHQVDREYRVMTALRDTDVPVPGTLLLCEDESILGTAFFLMDYVEGRVIMDTALPSFSPEERSALYDDFAKVLAAIHGVDLAAVGLENFGRPGNYYERQISRWTKQYRASETDTIPNMEALIEWLPAHVPDTPETTLVHGDYRIGNCIVHGTEPRIVAVLDWELSTTGHPLADLSYCAMMYRDDKLPLETGETGVPTEEEFVRGYCEYAGRGEIENWPFYIAYNLFRFAAIVQGVYKRGLDGIASSDRWQDRGDQVHMCAERGWGLVESMEKG